MGVTRKICPSVPDQLLPPPLRVCPHGDRWAETDTIDTGTQTSFALLNFHRNSAKL